MKKLITTLLLAASFVPAFTFAARDPLCNCRETVMLITGRTDIPEAYTGHEEKIKARAPKPWDIVVEYVPQTRAHVAIAVTAPDEKGNYWQIEGGNCVLQARIANIYDLMYAGVLEK